MIQIKSVFIIAWLALASAPGFARADEVNDVGADAEEMTADSDAALAQAADLKARLKREHQENQRKIREANLARAAAEQKRELASVQLTQDTKELDQIMAERKRTQKEIDRLNAQIAANEKAMHESQAQTAKAKRDLASVQAQKSARQRRLAEARAQAKAARAEAKAKPVSQN